MPGYIQGGQMSVHVYSIKAYIWAYTPFAWSLFFRKTSSHIETDIFVDQKGLSAFPELQDMMLWTTLG